MFGKIIAGFDNKNVYLQTLYTKRSYSLILSVHKVYIKVYKPHLCQGFTVIWQNE